jgi:predicted translin family RNA/ssDNA-binding protein
MPQDEPQIASKAKAEVAPDGPAAHASDALVSAALGAYLAELVSGKRVAILGDGSLPFVEQMAQACGRRVHVFDPDARRTAVAIAQSRGDAGRVRYALLETDSEIAAHAFDVVMVPSLAGLVAAGIDAAAAVSVADQMLAPRGFAAIATPASDAPIGYYELYDLISARFSEVRMLGAAPFNGVTVAAFGGEDEPAVAIDSTLSEGPEEPLAFIAIATASRPAPRLDPYLLVQLPVVDTVLVREAPEPAIERQPETDARLAELEAERARAREEAEGQAKALAAASMRAAELEAALTRQRELRRREKDELTAEHEREKDALQQELDTILERVAELESQLEAASTAPATAPAEDASLVRQAQAFEFQIAELKRLLAEARSESDALRPEAQRAKALDAELDRCKRQLEIAATLPPPLTKASEEDSGADTAADLAALEAQLKERGARVVELERQLRESDRIGRELVVELDAARAVTAASDVVDRSELEQARATAERCARELESLGQKCARHEADLRSSEWRIEALQRELEEARNAGNVVEGGDVDKLEAALRAAHDEIARLKLNDR